MSSLTQRLSDLNEDHFVTVEGGKTIIVSEGWDPALKRKILMRSTPEDIRTRYANEFFETRHPTTGNKSSATLGVTWLRSKHRRTYPGMEFAPGQGNPTEAGYFNLWQGWAVKARPGNWSLFNDHIKQIICKGDEKNYEYLLKWMAMAVQKPSVMPQVAVVLRGTEGIGKGIFAEVFGALFGSHYYKTISSKQVTGQFSGHLENVVLLFADEAVVANDPNATGILKGLITESYIGVEAKYRAAKMVRSALHVIMSSNNDWIVPAGAEARRFFVLDVSDKRRRDFKYFQAILDQMDIGGREGMFYDLQRVNLDGFLPQDFPSTAALADQKIHSLDPIKAWWLDCLENERIGPYEWKDEALQVEIGELVDNCQKKTKRQLTGRTLRSHLETMLPRYSLPNGRKYRGNKTWILPNLTLSKALFEQWLGEKVFNSLENQQDVDLGPELSLAESLGESFQNR